ncbi:hypothetical protein Airi01_020060 [Actinoallomurus iriomotensis]|uniref:Uncharacterized protein n=1 Tax=Actinoallomurus iriomotensis TaxID=478107 RepID=A0A9W6RDR7_9ACTN|nr:hypothetical protein Airi01_020060 [Actinoallomurus iriomotensis]
MTGGAPPESFLVTVSNGPLPRETATAPAGGSISAPASCRAVWPGDVDADPLCSPCGDAVAGTALVSPPRHPVIAVTATTATVAAHAALVSIATLRWPIRRGID